MLLLLMVLRRGVVAAMTLGGRSVGALSTQFIGQFVLEDVHRRQLGHGQGGAVDYLG